METHAGVSFHTFSTENFGGVAGSALLGRNVYCRDYLHPGEGAAYRRIEAARASRRFPVILQLIADGSATLTNLGLVAPRLTETNHAEVLSEIRHKTKTQVEVLVARLKPRPDVKTMIRRIPLQVSAAASLCLRRSRMTGWAPRVPESDAAFGSER